MTGFGVLAFLGPYAGPIVGAAARRADRFRRRLAAASFLISRVTGARVISAGGRRALRADHPDARRRAGAAERRPDPVRLARRCRCRRRCRAKSWEIGLDLLSTRRARSASSWRSLCAIGLYLFLTRTRLGKALRAAADNPIAAAYMGIDVDRAHRIAFGLGVGITAIAGGLIAISQSFQPYIGFDFVIVMYAGVVLGGMGSILGAFWGGLTIGLVQQMSTLVLPYQLQNTAIFVVFLLIIFFRPQGMFGRVWERT